MVIGHLPDRAETRKAGPAEGPSDSDSPHRRSTKVIMQRQTELAMPAQSSPQSRRIADSALEGPRGADFHARCPYQPFGAWALGRCVEPGPAAPPHIGPAPGARPQPPQGQAARSSRSRTCRMRFCCAVISRRISQTTDRGSCGGPGVRPGQGFLVRPGGTARRFVPRRSAEGWSDTWWSSFVVSRRRGRRVLCRPDLPPRGGCGAGRAGSSRW